MKLIRFFFLFLLTLLVLLILFSGCACSQTQIHVWKNERLLEILHDGTLVRSFAIDALPASMLPKRREGDGRTPEGVYRITRINRNSGSYKTLSLDYPNAADRARGYTGSGIGIHGNSASSGCIGMSNGDMDAILRILDSLHVGVGTVVQIRYSNNPNIERERAVKHQ